MGIRKKTLILIVSTITIFLAVLTTTSYFLVINRIEHHETDDITAHVLRVHHEIGGILKNLESICTDWAQWDDAYRFIQDRNPEFVQSNLTDSTLINLRLNFMVFFNRDNNPVHLQSYPAAAGSQDELVAAIAGYPNLLAHATALSRSSGVLFWKSSPYLVASHAIVSSDGNGPIRGTLVVGRALDAEATEQISTVLSIRLKIHPLNKFKDRIFFHRLLSLPKESVIVEPITADAICGYSVVFDLSGAPALILESTHQRGFYQQGVKTWQQNTAFMLVFGLVFIVLLMVLLDHFILNRLAELTRQVGGISFSGDRHDRVSVATDDEIGRLAHGINAMLDSIYQYHIQQVQGDMQYRAVVEDQNELIGRTDGLGNLTFVNAAFCRFFNQDSDELIGRCVSALMPDFPVQESTGSRSDGALGPSKIFRLQVESPTANNRWIQWQLRCLTDKSREISGYQLVGQDISERVAAESALVDNERFLRQMLDAISCGVMVIDTQERRIVDVNAAGAQLFERQRDDIIGKICHRLVCPKEMGNCPVIDHSQTIDLSERKLLKPDGRVLPILKSVASIERNGRSYLVESFIDISDLVKAQADLRKSEERYRQFFEEDITGDSLTTVDGKIIACNRAFARIFGYDNVEEIMAVNIESFYLSEGQRQTILDRLRKEKKIEGLELEFVHRSNRPLYTIGNLVGHFDSQGELKQIRGYLFDDTERVLLEKSLRQAHKMEAIGTLAGGIAHDFNNILSGVMGYTEIALLGLHDTEKTVEHLQKVLNAANRAKALVQQILTFSRQTEAENRPVKLTPIIDEVHNLMRASLPATIEIIRNIHSNVTVVADPIQIHQLIMNLCTNAGHAMKSNGGYLTITVEEETLQRSLAGYHHDVPPGNYVRISIEDTGAGIPDDIVDRVFDPFFSTKGKTEGTGLGLSVVHGIVSKLGGTIDLSSSARGTRFDVYLPRIEEPVEKPDRDTLPVSKGAESIVLIDDEDFQVDLGMQMLESFGYRVAGFTSSTKALAHIMENPNDVDLVITDMTMPQMTGTKLADRLLKIVPNIPIIVCTGYSEQITAETATSMGFRALLMKPVVMKELARTVRAVLDSD